jgi:hypothetical protein
MTEDELIGLAEQFGDWNGHTIEMNDVGIIAFARAVVQAEREACAVAIEELIPLLDPEREPTMRMCAYTCRNKYAPKEKNHD